jgi:hypothetical protein
MGLREQQVKGFRRQQVMGLLQQPVTVLKGWIVGLKMVTHLWLLLG